MCYAVLPGRCYGILSFRGIPVGSTIFLDPPSLLCFAGLNLEVLLQELLFVIRLVPFSSPFLELRLQSSYVCGQSLLKM